MKTVLSLGVLIPSLLGALGPLESYRASRAKPHSLIDVRTPAETAAEGMLKGAVNIPLQELPARMGEITLGPVFVYCRSGNRSAQAAALLKQAGYTVYDLGAYSNLLRQP